LLILPLCDARLFFDRFPITFFPGGRMVNEKVQRSVCPLRDSVPRVIYSACLGSRVL